MDRVPERAGEAVVRRKFQPCRALSVWRSRGLVVPGAGASRGARSWPTLVPASPWPEHADEPGRPPAIHGLRPGLDWPRPHPPRRPSASCTHAGGPRARGAAGGGARAARGRASRSGTLGGWHLGPRSLGQRGPRCGLRSSAGGAEPSVRAWAPALGRSRVRRGKFRELASCCGDGGSGALSRWRGGRMRSPARGRWLAAEGFFLYFVGQEWGKSDHSVFCLRGSESGSPGRSSPARRTPCG